MIIDKELLAVMAIQMMTIYKETSSDSFKESIKNWDYDVWLCLNLDTVPSEFHSLPGYIAAKEIKNSPLYKALEEEE